MTYKITLHSIKGQAYALYEKGMLSYFINELDNDQAVRALFPTIALSEVAFKSLTGIKIQELKPKSSSDKIALFIFTWKQHKGTTYRPTKEEKANITNVTVTQELLNTYFKATQYPLAGLKSISDYIRHYNEVRDLARNGTPTKKETFPDVYDRDFEKMIGDNPEKLTRYRAHLRALGWQYVDGGWKK